MGKLIRWLLKLAAVILLSGMLLLLAINLLFDPNDYKHYVTDLVQQETGHRLEIGGPVDIQWYPSAVLQLTAVRLTTSQHSKDAPLFSAAKLELKLDWWAMLEGYFRVEAMILQRPIVNLWRDKEGQGNWESLLHGFPSGTPQVSEEHTTGADHSFVIHHVQLLDASVHWLDHQSGKAFKLEHLNLSTGQLMQGKPTLIRTALSVAFTQPVMNLDVSLSGELDVDNSFTKIDISGMALEVNAYAEQLPDTGLLLELAADFSVQLPDQEFQFNDLSIAGVGTHITGQLHGKGFNGLPELDGRLVAQKTNLRSVLQMLGIPVDTVDSQVFTHLSADIGLQQQGEQLLIRPIRIELDDSTIQGELQLRAGDKQVLVGDLKLDRIDLDRYMSPVKAESATGIQIAADVESLRNLQLDADLAIDELTLNNINLREVRMKMQSSEGSILLMR